MAEGMEIDRVRKDTARSSDHIRSILAFIQKIEDRQDSPLQFGWEYYEDDDHESVPLITEYDALRFLFPWFRLEGMNEFFAEDAEDDPENLMMKLEEHSLQELVQTFI